MGLMLGQVVNNYDENMPGRVAVILLSREEGEGEGDEADNTRKLWARVVMPSSGGSWGHYFIPEIGDLVVVAFEQGNIERAYVIGCIPKTNDKILTKSKNEKNLYKKIVTKNGNSIIFEDVTEDEGGGEGAGGGGGTPGEKDKMTIQTALDMHHMIFDNEKKMMEIADKDKKNFLRFSTDEEKGHIEITAAKKITVKVGDNISLTMNGDTGAVVLKAKKFTVEADDAISLESQSRAEVKGGNVKVDASGSLKLSSGGPAELAGTPVKLG